MITVLRAGALTTVQDVGRPGLAHLGVPRSGAADLPAHLAANALVGNAEGAATLETTALGCTVRTEAPAVLAVTGARCDVFVGGVRAPWGAPVRLAAGQALEVGAAREGLRAYVAIRGGIAVTPVLGSRATDMLSGLGPAVVRDGDVLPVGAEAEGGVAWGTRWEAPARGLVSVSPGPRADWLGEDGWEALLARDWTVAADSNRVGVRLTGEPVPRVRTGELESEGLVLGAVQLPPSGLPVIFLADHPTTGGYPVVAVVDAEGVAAAAQARPGDAILLTRGR